MEGKSLGDASFSQGLQGGRLSFRSDFPVFVFCVIMSTCPRAGGVLVAEVTTVIVPVTHPVLRDALPTGALKLSHRTGVNAAHLITAIPTVIL